MTLCACGCGLPAPLSTRTRKARGQVRGEPVQFIRGHAMRGKTLSSESRRRMSQAHIGFRHTEESRRKMSAARPHGEDHPDWQGDGVAYSTIHRWVNRMKAKTGICSRCNVKRLTQWANLSGEYRRDLDDFVEMCVPCHKHFDIARRKAA